MTTLFSTLASFAQRRPGLYFSFCCALGLVGRWYWCDQNLARFLNPLAPLFA
jgi:hypothetical protein